MENLGELFSRMVTAFETKDLKATLAFFSDDAVVIDPHYPQPEMHGKAAITQGFTWGFKSLAKPGFTLRHYWGELESGVVEVDTHHVLAGGMKLNFPQIFVIETQNGLITRLQSFPPYPPHGIGGLITRATRLAWKVQGKIK